MGAFAIAQRGCIYGRRLCCTSQGGWDGERRRDIVQVMLDEESVGGVEWTCHEAKCLMCAVSGCRAVMAHSALSDAP